MTRSAVVAAQEERRQSARVPPAHLRMLSAALLWTRVAHLSLHSKQEVRRSSTQQQRNAYLIAMRWLVAG